MTKPFVFISYAWESDAFRAQVKALCDYLRANGVAVVVDFDHAISPPEVGWTTWMQHSIEDAALVLVVCSPSYKPRFEKRAPVGSGKGVAWEGAVISQELYNAAQRNSKFYPVFPDPFNFDDCPLALQPWSNGHAFPSAQGNILALVCQKLGLPPPGATVAANGENPYTPWQAPPRHFFGRADALRALQMALEQGRSVSLVGDRRIGKTSLLHVWQDRARGLGRVVVMLDGQKMAIASCASLVTAITGLPVEPGDDAEMAANALANWLNNFPLLPPLVLLDEAEAVLLRLPHRFFERLRGLIAARKVCLVLASAQPVEQVYENAGHTSPFLNLLELCSVGLLEPEAAQKMVALADSVFDADIAAHMVRWGGRHPYFLALYGFRMWEACRAGALLDDAQDRLDVEAKGRLKELWATLNERERVALCRVADGEVVDAPGLRVRGLVVGRGAAAQLFGEVLGTWLRGWR